MPGATLRPAEVCPTHLFFEVSSGRGSWKQRRIYSPNPGGGVDLCSTRSGCDGHDNGPLRFLTEVHVRLPLFDVPLVCFGATIPTDCP